MRTAPFSFPEGGSLTLCSCQKLLQAIRFRRRGFRNKAAGVGEVHVVLLLNAGEVEKRMVVVTGQAVARAAARVRKGR